MVDRLVRNDFPLLFAPALLGSDQLVYQYHEGDLQTINECKKKKNLSQAHHSARVLKVATN